MLFEREIYKNLFSSVKIGEPFFFNRNRQSHLGMATEVVCWEDDCGKQCSINAVDLISGDLLFISPTEEVEKAMVKIVET